jgi:hypothetical protein
MIATRSQVLSHHEILVRHVKRWAAGASASMLESACKIDRKAHR